MRCLANAIAPAGQMSIQRPSAPNSTKKKPMSSFVMPEPSQDDADKREGQERLTRLSTVSLASSSCCLPSGEKMRVCPAKRGEYNLNPSAAKGKKACRSLAKHRQALICGKY